MKWLALIGILIGLTAGLIPSTRVSADISDDITITATGIVVGVASGFTVTYIDDFTVQLDWTMPPGATNIKIMAKVNSYPDPPAPGAEPVDGYVLYEGNGNTVQDTFLDLDDLFARVYYRAWTQAGAAWSPLYVDGYVENPKMSVFAGHLGNLILLSVVALLVALAFWQRSSFLQILAGIVAIGFGIYWVTIDPDVFLYIMEGIAAVAVGVYILTMVGVDFIKEKGGY